MERLKVFFRRISGDCTHCKVRTLLLFLTTFAFGLQIYQEDGWVIKDTSISGEKTTCKLNKPELLGPCAPCVRTVSYGISTPILLASTVTAVVFECLVTNVFACPEALPMLCCALTLKCCDADDDYEMCFGDSDFCCDAEGLFKKVDSTKSLIGYTLRLNKDFYEYCLPCQSPKKEVYIISPPELLWYW